MFREHPESHRGQEGGTEEAGQDEDGEGEPSEQSSSGWVAYRSREGPADAACNRDGEGNCEGCQQFGEDEAERHE